MRFRSPSERTQLILLSPVIAPMAVVAIVTFGPIGLAVWLWHKYGPSPRPRQWERWYAWRPVKVGEDWERCYWRSRWAWLENVERHPSLGYRIAQEDHPHA